MTWTSFVCLYFTASVLWLYFDRIRFSNKWGVLAKTVTFVTVTGRNIF